MLCKFIHHRLGRTECLLPRSLRRTMYSDDEKAGLDLGLVRWLRVGWSDDVNPHLHPKFKQRQVQRFINSPALVVGCCAWERDE